MSSELDRFGFVDPTAGGDTHRLNLIANFERGTHFLEKRFNEFFGFTFVQPELLVEPFRHLGFRQGHFNPSEPRPTGP